MVPDTFQKKKKIQKSISLLLLCALSARTKKKTFNKKVWRSRFYLTTGDTTTVTMMFEMARSCASSSSSMTAPRRVTTMMTHRRHENFGQKQRHRCIKKCRRTDSRRRLEVNAGGGYAVSPEIEATRKPTPPTNPNLPKVLVAG